jgi:hypothetical protein
MLDIVNEIARAKYQNNTFMAWKDGGVIQNRLIEAILAAPIHIIATMRSKTEYSVGTDARGKMKPEKIGTAPIQRDGFEYEYDVIIDMGIDNMGVVNKTRCPALTGKVIDKPGAALAATLREWLAGAPPPVVVTTTPPTTNGKPHAVQSEPPPVYDSGPMPDDELAVSETVAAAFIQTTAELLKASRATVMERMKALGYTAVPGNPSDRLKAYRALKADLGENVQSELFDAPANGDEAQAAVETAAGNYG